MSWTQVKKGKHKYKQNKSFISETEEIEHSNIITFWYQKQTVEKQIYILPSQDQG